MAENAWIAGVEDAPTFDVDDGMFAQSIQRARHASNMLRDAGIAHAIIGGLAVHAHVFEIDGGIAHCHSNVDVLLNRADELRAARALKSAGITSVDLKALLQSERPPQCTDIRFVWAGEQFSKRDLYPAPPLDGAWIFPSTLDYNCLTVFPLLAMKLSSYRIIDIVHIQDLIEVHLISPEFERRLPQELRARLEDVKNVTRQEELVWC